MKLEFDSPVLVEINKGTFAHESYSLLELRKAFDELRGGYRLARRIRNETEKNSVLAKLSIYSNRVLKAMARKWAERGPEVLKRKIREMEFKEADVDRSLNPYDSVFLEFLRSERDATAVKNAVTKPEDQALRQKC
jgi:hypothetical protein